MNSGGRYGLNALLLALAVATLFRIVPITFKQPVGRDIVEYQNIAQNLAGGNGYRLDLKVFHATETPVRHYSGYDRAPLLPFALSLLNRMLPEPWDGRLIGPFLFLLTLILLYDTVRRFFPEPAAFWTTLLVGVHPGLLRLSLLPLTEPLVLFCVAMMVWALLRLEKPWVAGFAAALAFLARPATAVVSVVVLGACFSPWMRRRSPWGWLTFPLVAATGPTLLVWLNLSNEAPALLLPQSYLFRTLHYVQVTHLAGTGSLYETPWAFLGAHGMDATRQIAKHGLYYLQYLGDTLDGLGAVVVLIPLALWGFRSYNLLLPACLTVGIGVIDLLFYTVVWSTYDPFRFTAVFVAGALAATVLGGWVTLNEAHAIIRRPGFERLPALVMLSLFIMWAGAGFFSSYINWREEQVGGVYANSTERLWRLSDSEAWRMWVTSSESTSPEDSGVLATNVPWMAYAYSEKATVLLPWDLPADRWNEWVAKHEITELMLHRADWPDAHREELETLRQKLEDLHWETVFTQGGVEHWIPPSSEDA